MRGARFVPRASSCWPLNTWEDQPFSQGDGGVGLPNSFGDWGFYCAQVASRAICASEFPVWWVARLIS